MEAPSSVWITQTNKDLTPVRRELQHLVLHLSKLESEWSGDTVTLQRRPLEGLILKHKGAFERALCVLLAHQATMGDLLTETPTVRLGQHVSDISQVSDVSGFYPILTSPARANPLNLKNKSMMRRSKIREDTSIHPMIQRSSELVGFCV